MLFYKSREVQHCTAPAFCSLQADLICAVLVKLAHACIAINASAALIRLCARSWYRYVVQGYSLVGDLDSSEILDSTNTEPAATPEPAEPAPVEPAAPTVVVDEASPNSSAPGVEKPRPKRDSKPRRFK